MYFCYILYSETRIICLWIISSLTTLPLGLFGVIQPEASTSLQNSRWRSSVSRYIELKRKRSRMHFLSGGDIFWSVACVTWNFCLPELRVADAHVRVLLSLSSSFLLNRTSIYSCWSTKRTISVFQISSRELILAVRWHCQTRFECKDVNFAQWM